MPSAQTQHKAINELLQEFTLQIQTILEHTLVGIYVGGSLATHSFQHDTSDIDCYIITAASLSEDTVCKIEEMHKQFYSRKRQYVKKIEASYIPQQDLLDFDPNGKRPYFNEGCFYWGQYGHNFLIELHVLREKGITILGPDIKTLVKVILAQDLMLAIQKNLHEYWELTVNDVAKLRRNEDQTFAILTMCRTLYSLETGDITSKAEAAQWAIQNFDLQWKDLIEQAFTWKPGQRINQLEKTQRFIRFILGRYGLKN
jgi:Domain of unknown function (DUF4111)/Adenylate cyclase NT domain